MSVAFIKNVVPGISFTLWLSCKLTDLSPAILSVLTSKGRAERQKVEQ